VTPGTSAGASTRAILDQLNRLTAPSASTDDAIKAIPLAQAVLSKLSVREDSAEAMLRLGTAYGILNKTTDMCAVLTKAKDVSRGTRFQGAIDTYFDLKQSGPCAP
jgi:hypothetical protein